MKKCRYFLTNFDVAWNLGNFGQSFSDFFRFQKKNRPPSKYRFPPSHPTTFLGHNEHKTTSAECAWVKRVGRDSSEPKDSSYDFWYYWVGAVQRELSGKGCFTVHQHRAVQLSRTDHKCGSSMRAREGQYAI